MANKTKTQDGLEFERELHPEVESSKKKIVNKVVASCKLLTAKVNKNGDKIGIALLDFAAELPNGHFDALGVETPVIASWLPVTEYLLMLLEAPMLTDVGCILSGEGDFTQLVKVLSPEEFDLYKSLLN